MTTQKKFPDVFDGLSKTIKGKNRMTNTLKDLFVGDYVINVNSKNRKCAPLSLRRTVVDHTNDRVIALYDEEYMNANISRSTARTTGAATLTQTTLST